MKKILLTISLLATVTFSFAQDAEKENLKKNEDAASRKMNDIPDGWKKVGAVSFLFNQSAFNNDWSFGGASNIAGNLGVDYEFNFKKGKVVWDNKVIAAYGLTKLNGAANATKTDDRLLLRSLWGKKAVGNWYYSAFADVTTQMDAGLDKTGKRISQLFSPAYIQFGPGMLWKKSDDLKVNFAPATSRFIFVDKQYTVGGTSFGVDQGRTSRFEFGASISAKYKTTLMENITWENNLNLYSNYLDTPQNIDINYQTAIVMKVNKYMSANFNLITIYDDNTTSKVQVSEVFGLGVNFGF
jgi:Protein of unknown function (DUF3078)